MTEDVMAGVEPVEERFALTAHDEARLAEASLTPKQRQARARRVLKKNLTSYIDLESKSAAGHNHARLRMIRDFCEQEGIECPTWVEFWIRLHEAMERRMGILSGAPKPALYVGFTGPRSLPVEKLPLVQSIIQSLPEDAVVSVGDAAGLDALVRYACPQARVFRAENRSPRALVDRSQRMIYGVAIHHHCWLLSFPDAPCPAGVTPAKTWKSGKTPSGTWSTTALMAGLRRPVIVVWCGEGDPALPDWPGGAWQEVKALPWAEAQAVGAAMFAWVEQQP